MSAKNGDRSRYHRMRKQKLKRRATRLKLRLTTAAR